MSMFKRIEGAWSDGLQSGNRRPRLFVISSSHEVTMFTGASIPGALAVVGERFRKNGKWSETTYQLRLAPDAAMVECLEGLHQKPFDEYEAWSAVVTDCARVAQHSVVGASLRAAVEADYPKSMGRLDAREAALAALAPAPAPEPAPVPADEEYADVILAEVTPSMLHTEDGPVEVQYRAIDLDQARRIAQGMLVVQSAVGVTSTAARFTSELGVLVTPSDIRPRLQGGVVALISPARGEWYLAEVL